MQTTQETLTQQLDTIHITQLLKLHGVKTTKRSYITRAAKTLPDLSKPFTVPVLARRAGIPRSKGYPTIKELEALHLVKPLPKTMRPPDWDEYTRGMRRRYNKRHGLPLRGIEPRQYMYTPVEALTHLRAAISKKIQSVDQYALSQIAELTHRYKAIEDALASHQL